MFSKPTKKIKTLTYTEKAVVIQEVEKGLRKKNWKSPRSLEFHQTFSR